MNIELLILFLKMFFLFEKNIEFYEKRDLLWLKEINIYQNYYPQKIMIFPNSLLALENVMVLPDSFIPNLNFI